jgi:hypothetical protein
MLFLSFFYVYVHKGRVAHKERWPDKAGGAIDDCLSTLGRGVRD